MRALFTTVAAAAILALFAATASAESDPGRVVLGGSGTDAVPIAIDHLYPTASESVVYAIEVAEGREPAAIAVTLENLEDLERGCNRPEAHMGDVSCGDAPGNGELSRQLDLTISDLGAITAGDACPDEAGTVLTSGRIIDAEDVSVLMAEGVAGGMGRCVRFTFSVPDLPENNLMQTDATRFDLRFTAEQDTTVLGSQLPRPSAPLTPVASAVRDGVLALTGGRLIQLAGAGLLGLVGGIALVGRARDKRAARPRA